MTMLKLTRIVVPAGLALGMTSPALGQKQQPPAVGAPKDFELPAKRELTLPNGMALTLVPFGTVPKVAVMLAVRAGRINETADQVWLSDLTGDLMQEGTTTLTAAQLAEQTAAMGGDLSVNVGY